MGVAIIDLLPATARVRDVIHSWVMCELVDPVAWGKLVDDPAGSASFAWELMSAAPSALPARSFTKAA